MCGIIGVAKLGGNILPKEVFVKILKDLKHRGPDAEGFYEDDSVLLGHQRLSIIDLSSSANQPFTSHCGRYLIVYNGEIYNFKSVRKKLNGYVFKTQSDTEVVLAAFIEWGKSCLQHFNGMFAFAIWDKLEKSLFICRDRVGIKPLYFCQTEDYFIFSSEIRPIIKSGLLECKISITGVIDTLQYQSVHAPNTMIENIYQLPSGHYGILDVRNDKNSFTISPYWELDQKREVHGKSYKQITTHIRDLLFQAVERRLISDVPLGAFLSGGIDSSAIVAIISSISSNKINTFSLNFAEQEFDESKYSSLIAKRYSTNHFPILLTEENLLEELPHALNAMDTPSCDGVNSYILSNNIKSKGITVALTGLGGDELFAGYPQFTYWKKMQKLNWLWSTPLLLRRLTSKPISSILKLNNATKLRNIILAENPELSSIYPMFRQISHKKELLNVLTLKNWSNDTCSNIIANHKNINFFSPLSQISIAEISTYSQNVLLKDVDQMSMAVSLETRVPFFDHELIEYVLGVPDNIKYPFTPKKLLVDSLGPLLPKQVVSRRKQGFLFPWKNWLKNELRAFTDVRLRRLGQRKLFNEQYILSNWNDFLKGNKNVSWINIWALVVLEEWFYNNSIEDF